MGEALTGARVSSAGVTFFSTGKCLGSLCWNHYLDTVADETAFLEQTILADIIQTCSTWGLVNQTGQGNADSRLWPVAVQRNPRLYFTAIIGVVLPDVIRSSRVVDLGGDAITCRLDSNHIAWVVGIL